MKKKDIFIFIIFSCYMCSWANTFITKDLNAPRPGDKINLHKIQGWFNLNDTTVIDLTTIKIDNDYKISYNEYKDSSLICTQNREAEVFSYSGDTILLKSHRKPGLTLDYIIPEVAFKFPLSPQESVSGLFFAEGVRAMRDYARISGIYNISADYNNFIIITPEADTISNLFHTKYMRHGSTFIDNDFSHSCKWGDSTILSPDSIMWHLQNDSITHLIEHHRLYARGYRYPILETRLHKVLYFGETVDSSFVTLYCDKESQSHDLASDPLNEQIRLSDAEISFRNNFNNIATTKSRDYSSQQSFMRNDNDDISSSFGSNESCRISATDVYDAINISYTTQPESIVAVTLHNSAGALMWHTSKVAVDSQGEITYPTHELVAGEYLVTVFLKNSQYTFKFIKK